MTSGTVAVLVLASACGSVDERRSAAQAAALRFETALRERDVFALCDALAPGTREEVAQVAKAACH
ncbi:hypothetical protein [Streptomyces sp. KR80]|uniref:hypothetical protein n=1 Tax=Streptomyces sp. KR80 TaxID=3457426 RepID=UPI003FD466FB